MRHGVTTLGWISSMSMLAAVPQPSHFDHGGPEVTGGASPVFVPGQVFIKHRKYFVAERELYGYRPRFMPGEVYFDAANRPWIRTTGLLDKGDRTAYGAEQTYIQTMTDQGAWVVYTVEEILDQTLKARYPTIRTTGNIARDVWSSNTRVLPDRAGNIYTLVSIRAAAAAELDHSITILLHKPRDRDEWSAYELPAVMNARPALEPTDATSDQSSPPLIVTCHGCMAVFLSETSEGALIVSEPMRLSHTATSSLNPGHSGAAMGTASIGDTVYCAYGSGTPFTNHEGIPAAGTPQFLRAYNRRTGEFSEPLLLGFGQNCFTTAPDNHNGPAMVVLNAHPVTGLLQVILGAHQAHFYVCLVAANSETLEMSHARRTPVPLGDRRTSNSGFTYTAFLKDLKSRRHLITRNCSMNIDDEGNVLLPDRVTGTYGRRHLDYFRSGSAGDREWLYHGPLVMPAWPGYSIFYHRLTMDRKGRLFLSYFQMLMQAHGRPDWWKAYVEKWPEDNPPQDRGDGKADPVYLPHDPVILMSDDNGETWRFAVTADFAAGLR